MLKHRIYVAKVTGKGKRKKITDVREIPSNEVHNYARQGFVALDAEETAEYRKFLAKEASKKRSKAADNDDSDDDAGSDDDSGDGGSGDDDGGK